MSLIRNKDIQVSIFFIILAIAIYLLSFNIISMSVFVVGPDFVPKLVAFGIALCAILLGISSYQNRGNDSESTSAKKGSLGINRELISVFLLILIYIILLNKVGYLIMTSVYLFGHFMVMAGNKNRNIPVFLIASIVFSVATYYLFRNVFSLFLPAGILG